MARKSAASSRPLLSTGVAELERLFGERQSDEAFLQTLLEELTNRRTDRAQALRERVMQALGKTETHKRNRSASAVGMDWDFDESDSPDYDAPIDEQRGEGDEALDDRESDKVDLSGVAFEGEDRVEGVRPGSPATNEPKAILDAWIALEVLSPQTFDKPEDLVDGDRRRIARFDQRPRLPWEDGGERARPNTKLFYQVILGAIRMDLATESLLKAFGDRRPERPRSRALAALAVVMVDRQGRPLEDMSVVVSSFGWGCRQIRQGKLEQLRHWPSAERSLVQGLIKQLVIDRDGEVLPLDRTRIEAAYKWLADTCAIPEAQRISPYFALRVYQWFGLSGTPEPTLLNSFFLDDLAKARQLIEEGKETPGLRQYVGIRKPSRTIDLLKERSALESLVAPSNAPEARWPGPGRHSLVLLQQAAINLAFKQLDRNSDDGLVAVNGPPGTGKTTVLRDLVAGVLLGRAKALCLFDDPEQAFTHRSRTRQGQAFIHLYEVDARIRGYEILVASSNNRAVENISREIPGWDAIDRDLPPPRYFRTTADAVAGEDGASWGLTAAVLSNSANRFQFLRAFWRDEDDGFRSYLWAATGADAKVTRTDPESGSEIEAVPRVVLSEKPPAGKEEALQRWRVARRRFRQAVSAAQDALGSIDRMRQALQIIESLRAHLAQSYAEDEVARRELVTAKNLNDSATEECRVAEDTERHARRLVEEWSLGRPGFFARLFRTRRWLKWQQEHSVRLKHQDTCSQRHNTTRLAAERSRVALSAAEASAQAARDGLQLAQDEFTKAEALIARAKTLLGQQHFADQGYWDQDHTALQASTPWLTRKVQALRDKCFVATFELHRAFIDAAARPIRNNLAALFGILRGTGLDSQKASLLPSLWSTLFLVVPVVSTTFASVARMLGPLPPQSLGWLLVDEGGQALPQAAVGALMRARRAVVVGDPLQIEPVVTLPLSLVEKVCEGFGVDAEEWAAPKASAQTLADAGSLYQGWIERPDGAVRIGAPLLVHRRCEQPMFGISNAVSYAGLMVRATRDRSSRIRDVLGPSRWLHLEGFSDGKWCPHEGEVALDLIAQLVRGGIADPDVFLIAPFRAVVYGLRERFGREADVLARITSAHHKWLYDRIGTVHTVQGKEAEAVIFVLGATNPQQSGARSWAGSPPNLVNVAVSRAKQALYVVGNRNIWRAHGSFRTLAERMDFQDLGRSSPAR